MVVNILIWGISWHNDSPHSLSTCIHIQWWCASPSLCDHPFEHILWCSLWRYKPSREKPSSAGYNTCSQRNSEHNSWGNQYRRTFQHFFPENNLNIARRNKLVDLYMPMCLQVCLKFSNRLSLLFMSFSIIFTFRLLMVFHLRRVYFFGTAS